eukprot:864805-Amphidinium_carterae.1
MVHPWRCQHMLFIMLTILTTPSYTGPSNGVRLAQHRQQHQHSHHTTSTLQLKEFDDKKLKSITKEGFEIDGKDEKKKKLEEMK